MSEHETHADHSEQPDFWRYAAELVKTAVIIVVLAYLIRVFFLQPFIVDGSSMYPQFHSNDYLLVDKVSYRLHEPHRGDIVVFRYPNDITLNYVKRIIGLPGERVKLVDGKVEVFNSAHPQGEFLNEPYVSPGNVTSATNGKTDFTVDSGTYLVLGDNRQASSDSRDWGLLPKDDLVGKVLLLAYPVQRLSLAPHASYQE